MSCPVRTVCHPNKSCSRVHEPREAKGKDIIYLSEPSSLTDALFKRVCEIPHNVPVNTEALPAHIENPALSGIPWIPAVKLESRKSATVHTILTRAGHFPSGKPKPGFPFSFQGRKGVFVLIFVNIPENAILATQLRLTIHNLGRKGVSFPNIWLSSGQTHSARPFILWTPPAPLCLSLSACVGKQGWVSAVG